MIKAKSRKILTIACSIFVAAFMVLSISYASIDGSINVEPGVSHVGVMAGESVLDAILAVFTSIGTWISTTIPTFFTLFYAAETGLTFLGVLAVAGLAFSVVFLIIGIIQKFLHFAG